MGSRAVALVAATSPRPERFGCPKASPAAVTLPPAVLRQPMMALFIDRLRLPCSGRLFEGAHLVVVLLDAELLPWSVEAEVCYETVASVARGSRSPAGRRMFLPGGKRGLGVAACSSVTRARAVNASRSLRRTAGILATRELEGRPDRAFSSCSSEGANYHDDRTPTTWRGRPAGSADPICDTDRSPSGPTPRRRSSGIPGGELTAAGRRHGRETRGTRSRPPLPGQPGWRGRGYLRISTARTIPILPSSLSQPCHKRSMASLEYALGLEALERSARGEPLWRPRNVSSPSWPESDPSNPRHLGGE